MCFDQMRFEISKPLSRFSNKILCELNSGGRRRFFTRSLASISPIVSVAGLIPSPTLDTNKCIDHFVWTHVYLGATYELKRGGVMSWNFLKLGVCDGPQGGSWCPNQQDRNILRDWPVESGQTNRVPTDLLYVEMGGGGFLRCAMKATLIDVKANVENFFQIKAHLKKFQFSVCHHI